MMESAGTANAEEPLQEWRVAGLRWELRFDTQLRMLFFDLLYIRIRKTNVFYVLLL